MCGRFTLTSSGQAVAESFDLDEVPELRPRFNIAPSQMVTVIRADTIDAPFAAQHRWGLVPSWARDSSIGNRLINARSESAADKPAFRSALRKRRCIVPADGFYEWGGPGRIHQPHLFRRPDRRPFGMAGLWEHRRVDGGAVLLTCTLLTTRANEVVGSVHPRMPVILEPRDYQRWLDPELVEPGRLLSLFEPCASEVLEVAPVGLRVNDPRHDDPECLEAPGPSLPL